MRFPQPLTPLVGGVVVSLAIAIAYLFTPAHTPETPPTAPFDPIAYRDSLIIAEAERAGISAALMLAVARVENPAADSLIVSRVGAVGLLQVMPRFWAHSFEEECGCGPLTRAGRNVCVGVRVFKFYLDSLGAVDRALRAYHGSDKPHLHQAGDGYTAAVLQAAFSQ